MDQLSGWDVQRVVGLYRRVCGRYSHVRRDRDAGFDNAAELCGRNFLLVLSYVSIFHMISMLSSSKTTPAVVCILAGVFMMVFAGDYFFEIVSAGDDHTGGNRKWRNRYGNSKKSCFI